MESNMESEEVSQNSQQNLEESNELFGNKREDEDTTDNEYQTNYEPTVTVSASPTTEDVDNSLIVRVDDTQDLDMEDPDSNLVAASDPSSPKKDSRKEKSTSSSKKKESSGKDRKTEGGHKGKDDLDSCHKKDGRSGDSVKEAKSRINVGKGDDSSDRSVWVTGLTKDTKASDLQSVFKKHGKVVGAKIITNTKIPGSRYLGLITMETVEQVSECIKELNKSKFDGRTISLSKERPSDSESSKSKDSKSRDKDKKDKGRDRSRSPRRNRRRSPFRRPEDRRPLNPRLGPPVRPGGRVFVPSRDRIMNPSELRRIENERLARRRERITRENEERRRHESERRQRDDLEREKEKLRIERERLEKERAELIRLERERARLERERIEREKEELRRRLQREEQEMRRPIAPSGGAPIGPGLSALKRPYDSRDAAADVYWDESRKRQIIGHAVATESLSAGLSSRLGSYDSVGQNVGAGMTLDGRYDSYAARAAATLASDSRYSGYAAPAADTRGSSGSNGRHGSDRDDRGRGGGMSSASTSGSSFYRADLRSGSDSRDSRVRNNGSGNRGSDERRETRPASAVTSMMSSVSSTSSVGPAGGMYPSSGAPLGPSSLMSHSSMSSGSLGPSSLERGYRRF